MKATTASQSLNRKVNTQLTFIQSSFWMTYLPFSGFSVVLLRSKSFSDGEIGLLLFFQALASIIIQPLLSGFLSRNPTYSLKKVIALMMVCGGLFSGLLFFIPHLFVPALVVFVVQGATINAAPAFINALCMQLQSRGIQVNYGLARGMGSLFYALLGVGLGKLVDMVGAMSVLWVFIPLTALTALLLLKLYIPEEAISSVPTERVKSGNIWRFLVDNRRFGLFCLASSGLFISHACINSYLPAIMDYLGGNVTDQGITRAIAAAVELPIMFIFIFVARRFSSPGLLALSGFSFLLKAVATFLAPSVTWLFLVQLLQMPAFGLYTPSAVLYSDQAVHPREQVRAQALAMMFGMGIGYAGGNLLGGWLLDWFGLTGLFAAAILFAFLGFVLMLLGWLLPKPKTAESSL